MEKNGTFAAQIGKYSIALKLLLLGGVILVLLVPLAMIRGLVREREMRRFIAEDEIVSLWGGEVTVAGPVLTVPFRATRRDEKGNAESYVDYAHFLPAELEITATADPQVRSRGIYDVTLYECGLQVTATFLPPDLRSLRIDVDSALWEEATISVSLPDLRSLRAPVTLRAGDQDYAFRSASALTRLLAGEISARGGESSIHGFAVSFDMRLGGGRQLRFTPLGGETLVRLESSWPSPSFAGAFLPSTRELDATGFEAEWYVHSLSRNYPAQWISGSVGMGEILGSSFGVDFIVPVDAYLKTERSVKYGILFVFLPFVVFFLLEVFGPSRVHILQYLLVGIADVVFYLLLLSLSEHLPFAVAYAAAAGAVTAVVCGYACSILPSRRAGLLMLPVLGSAYLFLYTVLLSEDYALLIGSLGVFVMVAAIMLLTRKVNWYDLRGASDRRGPDR